MKKEVVYFDHEIDHYKEYSLEELTLLCNNIILDYNIRHKEAMDKGNFKITRYTIFAEHEWDYDEGNIKFGLRLYRTETDSEYNSRLIHEAKFASAKQARLEAKERQDALKRLEQEKRLKDPEYQKYLELLNKFHKK